MWRERRCDLCRFRVSFGGDENAEIQFWWWLYNSEIYQKPSNGLYGWIFWYMNCISIKQLKLNKTKSHWRQVKTEGSNCLPYAEGPSQSHGELHPREPTAQSQHSTGLPGQSLECRLDDPATFFKLHLKEIAGDWTKYRVLKLFWWLSVWNSVGFSPLIKCKIFFRDVYKSAKGKERTGSAGHQC